MERLLILVVLITQVIINTKAQNEIKGGPWNTLFGESVDEVIRKIENNNPGVEMHRHPIEYNIIGLRIETPTEIDQVTYGTGEFKFLYENGHTYLKMCEFNKIIPYENAFHEKLDKTQAKDWLKSNTAKVANLVENIKNSLIAAYGEPFKSDEEMTEWIGERGNYICLSIEYSDNIFSDLSSGYIPAYTLTLIFLEDSRTREQTEKHREGCREEVALFN